MRLDLAERLRCPRPHAASPLVVVARETVDRDLLSGLAGCPVCYAEAHVLRGDVHFAGAADAELRPSDDDAEAVERLIALLGLAEPGGAVLLTGRYARQAAALAARIDVAVVARNAAVPSLPGLAAVFLEEPSVPFSDHTFRGAALDADTSLPVLLDALRCVAPGGRVIGAQPLTVPAGVRELARDALEWVGERDAGPQGIVTIRRA